MDRFNQISFNRPKKSYSNFGEDMYGTSVNIPVHAQRSLYGRAPIYFGDYGYPYGYHGSYYGKPPSGGVFAADGEKDEKPSSPISPLAMLAITAIGGLAGYFISGKDNKTLGVISGVSLGAAGSVLIRILSK